MKDGESPELQVHSTALSNALSGNNPNVNILSIFGPAREGKSYLMNTLLGDAAHDVFPVSARVRPVTVGVDISSSLMPLSHFTGSSSSGNGDDMEIALLDAEGQPPRTAAVGDVGE